MASTGWSGEVGKAEVTLDQLRQHGLPSGLPIPTKNPSALPFGTLDPTAFERLVAEIVTHRDNHSVHFYGRSGQAQHGLDIVEELEDGQRVVYQVRRYSSVTSQQINGAVVDFVGSPQPHRTGDRGRRFDAAAFTLVTSAPVDHDTALVDAITGLQDNYRNDLRVDVWGEEMVSRLLRPHPGLVSAVFGEAWAQEFCGRGALTRARKDLETQQRIESAVRGALSSQYDNDDMVRFRQIDLSGINVDSLFVDVPTSSRARTSAAELLLRINPKQSRDHKTTPTTSGDDFAGHAGAAQALLHPDWNQSCVVVGGPGQGKTTLLQYLCQHHRARYLGKDAYSPISAGLNPVSETVRVALRIELSAYAEWRRKRLAKRRTSKKVDRPRNATIERYLVDVIARASGVTFSVRDFSIVLASRSMLLALDGLDEVAGIDERDTITQEIRQTRARLSANGHNALIIAATRPGSVGRPLWREPEFAALFLEPLTTPLRMQYLDRWTKSTKLDADEVRELRATFESTIGLSHVSDLAGNPMQLAILLHLMQRRTVLPEKRTALYERYLDVFMDRESKSKAVGRRKDLIVQFHQMLAWHIHTQIENQNSTGSIHKSQLHDLLTDYLEARGEAPDVIAEIFDSVTGRVLCLVQTHLDSDDYQFEVQPLREFFAAQHIYDSSPNNNPRNNRPGTLEVLARRPFWSNAMRFFAGKVPSGEVPSLAYVLRDLQADPKIGEHPVSRIAGKALLDDHVFAGQTEILVRDMVDVVLDGPGSVFAVDGLLHDGDGSTSFLARGGRKQAVELLRERLGSEDSKNHSAALALLVSLDGVQSAATEVWALKDLKPGVWLRLLAESGALGSIPPDKVAALEAAISSLPASETLLPLLVGNKVQAIEPMLVNRCLKEIGDGLYDSPRGLSDQQPYFRLISAAGPERFFWHLKAIGSAGGPVGSVASVSSARRRTRSRRKGEHESETVMAMAKAHSAVQPGMQSVEWASLLDDISAAWGRDVWPVREGLVAAGVQADGFHRETPRVSDGATWREVGRWRSDAIDRRSDSDWWAHEIAQMDDAGLGAMTLLSTAAQVASAQVIVALCGELGELAERLDRRRISTIAGSVERYRRWRPEARELMLAELLRLGRFTPTGRLASILWPIVSESSRPSLSSWVMSDAAGLWQSGPSMKSVLVGALGVSQGRVPADTFRGARTDLVPGTLTEDLVRPMTYEESQQILRDPADWPTDVVRFAAARLGRRLAGQRPVVEEAASRGWGV